MYAMMMIELIYLLYTSTVYRLCTNSHANHCVLYAITPQYPCQVHQTVSRASARATATRGTSGMLLIHARQMRALQST